MRGHAALVLARRSKISFFYNAVKTETKKPKKTPRLADIPVSSLQALGCSVCPHDKIAADLKSPKMEPSGARSPTVYLLGGSPSREEDEDNNHWTDDAGHAIYKVFGRSFMERHVRSNFIAQCMGERTAVVTECCRPRVIADIEESKPLLVVTIGDEPLRWAVKTTGNALRHRGTLFAAKIGKHKCWVYSMLYPNYALKKKGYGKSEYELATEHDVARIKTLVEQGLPEPKVITGDYDKGVEIITGEQPGDFERLEKALWELAQEPDVGMDYETTGLRPFMLKDPMLLTCAVGTFTRTVAFPVDHPEGWQTPGRRQAVRTLLLQFILYSGVKIAHNLAFEMEWTAWAFSGEVLRKTEWDDTMALCHTLDEREGTKSLDFQCIKYFGFSLKGQSNIDTKRLLEYPLPKVLRYNGMDAKWTHRLRDVLRAEVAQNESDVREAERKVRLAPTLVLTEIIGLPVDFKYAEEMGDKLLTQIKEVEAKLRRCQEVKDYERKRGTFSPDSPEHVLALMRDICHRDEVKQIDQKTGAVSYTTGEEVLAKIPAKEVPSAALILEHRGASKLHGTYITPILTRKIVGPDGLVRCKYSSMVAETGRLASEDPNIQNWPKRKHKEVRGIFYAVNGQWFVAFDYGQIEFRVVGMASEDPNLVKACWTGYDVHRFWAERIVAIYPEVKDWIVEEFSVDWDEKGIKTLRQEAKNKWVFPQLFGASVRSCAESLHLPEWVAEDLSTEFWDEFSAAKKWQDRLLKSYEKNLYVETLGGRKRRGPMTKNQIINHPIQGTAADIVTAGMVGISELSELMDRPDLHPRLNIHDDLSFMLNDATMEDDIPIIAREMCMPRFDYINVPLVVEVQVGSRWHALEEIKVYKSHEIFNTPNPYEAAHA